MIRSARTGSMATPGRALRRLMRALSRLALAWLALHVPLADAAAQTGTVQGRVVDAASKRPIPGVAVSLLGTSIGMSTNQNGRFLLLDVAPGEYALSVELVGYAPEQRAISVQSGEVTVADVEIRPSPISLEEVVVTGVGVETSRRALGTNVAVIGSDVIDLAPVQSIDQLLQGRVAGGVVSQVSAQPGTGSLVRFRGTKSVFGAQTPVIYVDGVRVDNDQSTAMGTGGEQSSALADLVTSDVEHVEITRGGAASTLFGSDAANGVIQIFTKKGRPGAPKVTARIEQGVLAPELKYIFDARTIFPDLVEKGETSPSFMKDNYFKTGRYQSYYIGASGGDASTTFSISARLEDLEGTQPKDGSTNYNLRGGLRTQATENLVLEFSGSYVRHNFQRLFNGAAINDPLTTFEVGDALLFSRTETLDRALDVFLMPDIDEWVSRFIVSASARWRGSGPLRAKASIGVDNRANQQRALQPIGFTVGISEGFLARLDRDFTAISVDAGATYSRAFLGGALTSDLSLGAQGFRDDETIIAASGRDFALPGVNDFDAAATIAAQEGTSEVFNGGVYLDEQLGFRDKLYLGAGLRLDAGSSFGDEIDIESYPKVTASYVVNEDFDIPFVDELKVRFAYGQTGKFPGAFLKDRTFSASPFRGESAPRFANPGNRNLRPEKTSTLEGGFDAALLGQRAGLSVTYFDARTSDALFSVPRQPVTGLGFQQENVGLIWNTGFELEADVTVIRNQLLDWSVGGAFAYVHNEVLDMGGVPEFAVDGSQQYVSEGRPIGSWKLTMPEDSNGDGFLDSSTTDYTGGFPTPDKSGSFSTTLRVGGSFSFTALADWAGGHEVFDWGSVWATANKIYRRQRVRCGLEPEDAMDCAQRFPIKYDSTGASMGPFSRNEARSAFLYDGDYFKLREVGARYTLPESISGRAGVSRATIYASGRNLWIWSRNRMVDPELSGLNGGGLELGGETSITLPPNRILRLGVEVLF